MLERIACYTPIIMVILISDFCCCGDTNVLDKETFPKTSNKYIKQKYSKEYLQFYG